MGLLKSLSCDDRKHVTQRVGIPRARSTGDRNDDNGLYTGKKKKKSLYTGKDDKGLYTGKNKGLYTGKDNKGLCTEENNYRRSYIQKTTKVCMQVRKDTVFLHRKRRHSFAQMKLVSRVGHRLH